MTIRSLTETDELWDLVADFAEQCSWKAGKSLAKQMRERTFREWERVFAAIEQPVVPQDATPVTIKGYCTFAKTDCLPDLSYSPYIGFVFVEESFRGQRLSERLIQAALAYARQIGFPKVYLVSDHVNLYEKYGFVKIDEKPAPWDPLAMESIYEHLT
jgi:GNAT superfamily N-acetyltransferase